MRKSVIFTVLALSLLFAAAALQAQQNSSGGMLGPLHPPLVDTNGNGRPDPGDTPVLLQFNDPELIIDSPWDCNADGDNEIDLGDESGGKYHSASRTADGQVTQRLMTTGFDGGGNPDTFGADVTYPPNDPGPQGTGQLVDTDNNGFFDAIAGQRTGGGLNFILGLQTSDGDGDRLDDHVGIPWSQINALESDPDTQIRSETCGPQEAMLFIPLVDTNGDGVGDRIIPDLDGDGEPDAKVFSSPLIEQLRPAPIPTASEWGLIILALALITIAIFTLRRQRFDFRV